MEQFEFSLLYPTREQKAAHEAGEMRPTVSEETAESLGLSSLISLKNSSLTSYFTTDTEVIKYRSEIFADMLRVSEISDTFVKVLPILSDIAELRRMSSASERTTDAYLLSLSEIELYISTVEMLKSGLLPVREKLLSKSLISLCEYVKTIAESEYSSCLVSKQSYIA